MIMGRRTKKRVYIKEYTIRALPHTMFFEASSKELLTVEGTYVSDIRLRGMMIINDCTDEISGKNTDDTRGCDGRVAE